MSDSSFFYRLIDSSVAEDGTLAETFATSSHTHSPWGTELQHGGPVGALLTRAMERIDPRPSTRISRVHVDILGAVRVADVRVSARIVRPGRRIELLESTLETQTPDGSWRAAARGSGWRLATQPTPEAVSHAYGSFGTPPGTDREPVDFPMPESWSRGGFVEAVNWDFRHLGSGAGDPSAAWMSLSMPLVAGETASPLTQLVAISDIANGLGARLDPQRYSFLNTDLSIQVFDEPVGPWFGMEAESSLGNDGVGMGDGVLHGPHGPIGRVTQNLLVEPIRLT